MKTRAKFVCDRVAQGDDGDYHASLSAVVDGSPENEKFFKYTPGGEINLYTVRGDHFVAGTEYYVDFTPAEED